MNFKEWFIEERARALAVVLLTRRNDLVLEETSEGSDLDFVVSMHPDADHGDRRFGILLKATMTPITLEEANKHLKPTLASARSFKVATYPICGFYFTAKDDQGYFTWVYEPVVTAKGQPKLKYHAASQCGKLNDQTLHEIIMAVHRWYDALSAMLAT